MKVKYLLASLLAIASASSASAATIIYTVSGTAGGTLNGSAFRGNFTITSKGDTASQQPCIENGMPIAGCSLVLNDSLELDIEGLGVFQVVRPSLSFVNNASNIFGFSEFIAGTPPVINTFAFVNLGLPTGPFSTWDGASDLASFDTNLFLNNNFAPFVLTDGGELTFNQGPPTDATFSASLLSNAVPEPATWAFMIFGFGAIGSAMRRQRKTNVKVSYA